MQEFYVGAKLRPPKERTFFRKPSREQVPAPKSGLFESHFVQEILSLLQILLVNRTQSRRVRASFRPSLEPFEFREDPTSSRVPLSLFCRLDAWAGLTFLSSSVSKRKRELAKGQDWIVAGIAALRGLRSFILARTRRENTEWFGVYRD